VIVSPLNFETSTRPVDSHPRIALGFDLWSSDVNQAYLQKAEQLQRESLIRPDMPSLATKEFLKLMFALYEITESSKNGQKRWPSITLRT
jgi:hypothetical protein